MDAHSQRAALLASALAIGLQGCATTPPQDKRANLDIRPVRSASAPTAVSDGMYDAAAAAITRGDYARALDLLQVANGRGADVRVLNAFGVVYDALGRFDLSRRYYARAQAMDPTSTIVAHNLAYSQVLQGKSATTAMAAAAPAPARALAAEASPSPTPAVTIVAVAPVAVASVAAPPVPPSSPPISIASGKPASSLLKPQTAPTTTLRAAKLAATDRPPATPVAPTAVSLRGAAVTADSAAPRAATRHEPQPVRSPPVQLAAAAPSAPLATVVVTRSAPKPAVEALGPTQMVSPGVRPQVVAVSARPLAPPVAPAPLAPKAAAERTSLPVPPQVAKVEPAQSPASRVAPHVVALATPAHAPPVAPPMVAPKTVIERASLPVSRQVAKVEPALPAAASRVAPHVVAVAAPAQAPTGAARMVAPKPAVETASLPIPRQVAAVEPQPMRTAVKAPVQLAAATPLARPATVAVVQTPPRAAPRAVAATAQPAAPVTIAPAPALTASAATPHRISQSEPHLVPATVKAPAAPVRGAVASFTAPRRWDEAAHPPQALTPRAVAAAVPDRPSSPPAAPAANPLSGTVATASLSAPRKAATPAPPRRAAPPVKAPVRLAAATPRASAHSTALKVASAAAAPPRAVTRAAPAARPLAVAATRNAATPRPQTVHAGWTLTAVNERIAQAFTRSMHFLVKLQRCGIGCSSVTVPFGAERPLRTADAPRGAPPRTGARHSWG